MIENTVEVEIDDRKIGEPENDSVFVDETKDKNVQDVDAVLSSRSPRVLYQTNNMLLPQLVDLMKQEKVLDVRPEYQRRIRWNIPQRSKLIESLLLNVPIPSIYWFETEEARYEVMDGQQRLSAILDFFTDSFPLTGLVHLYGLNKLMYSELSDKVKRTIDRASLNTVILLLESRHGSFDDNHKIEKSTEIDLRRLIFEKLNTGGTRLNPQEIRNALYSGKFNDAIIELSRNKTFTTTFGLLPYTDDNPNNCINKVEREKQTVYKTMRDCEIVLRFFAFRDRNNIRGSQVSMLDRALEKNRNLDVNTIELEKDRFVTRLEFLYELFNEEPFKIVKKGRKNPIISVNLYDAFMVAIDELWDNREEILEDKNNVQKRMEMELSDEENYNSMTGLVITAKAINKRIEIAKKILYKGK